ncbi:MAG: gliding motility lipoprotein GldH [Bacteroidetes bacterium]|nr:gliding motility lipoprotein GldH [Bacteroidota bacterium]
MSRIKTNWITRITATLLQLLALLFSSCDRNRIFEQNQSIPESGWAQTNPLKFDVDIKDPSTSANFYVNVRNADGYPYGNIFLFIKTVFPNGKLSNDTLECVLSDEKGKWLGKGMGDIYDNQIPFKRNVRFPMAGSYHFEIAQGMRIESVPLIMDVGLRIEKAE